MSQLTRLGDMSDAQARRYGWIGIGGAAVVGVGVGVYKRSALWGVGVTAGIVALEAALVYVMLAGVMSPTGGVR